MDSQINFKIFGSNKRVYVGQRVGKKSCNPLYHTNHKAWKRICYGVEGLLPILKSGNCTRWRANWKRSAITACCSIMQSHLECSLWMKDLYWCKIMAQSILVNSASDTFKAKRNMSFNWYLCHPRQFLQENCVELSSVYFQSLVERMPCICKAAIVAKGGHFHEAKVYQVFLNIFLV